MPGAERSTKGRPLRRNRREGAPAGDYTQAEPRSNSLKVALAHHWLTRPRGGERVLAQLARMFPEAPIFTSIIDRGADWPPEFAPVPGRVRTSALQRLYSIDARLQPFLAPLMPAAFRAFGRQLAGFDLLLVSDAGLAKCIPVPPGVRKLVYLHTPMRRVWLHVEGIGREFHGPLRPLAAAAVRRLRAVDRRAAATVDLWAANSLTTRDRAAAAYGLAPESIRVIYPSPPRLSGGVATAEDDRAPRSGLIVVSPLARYKRDDLAVLAATRLGIPLTVVGEGPERARLERIAGPTVKFAGFLPDAQLVSIYRGATGLLFSAEEDFGLVPVEAMREGCPVLAFRAGGAVETVREGVGGLFFDEPTLESVMDGIARLLSRRWDPAEVRRSVERFAPEAFERELRDWLGQSPRRSAVP